MSHNLIFIPSGAHGDDPYVVLAPPCYSLDHARNVVEEVLQQLPANYTSEDLAIALGRRGFVWPNSATARVAA